MPIVLFLSKPIPLLILSKINIAHDNYPVLLDKNFIIDGCAHIFIQVFTHRPVFNFLHQVMIKIFQKPLLPMEKFLIILVAGGFFFGFLYFRTQWIFNQIEKKGHYHRELKDWQLALMVVAIAYFIVSNGTAVVLFIIFDGPLIYQLMVFFKKNKNLLI